MNTMSSLTYKSYTRLCKSGSLWFSSKPKRFEIRQIPSVSKLNPGVEPSPIRKTNPDEDDGGLLRFLFVGTRKTKHVEVMKFVQSRIDFRKQTIEHWLARRRRNRQVANQTYQKDQHEALGPDLATAYFLLPRGCAVQFEGKPWYRLSEMKEIKLPSLYQEGWILRAIDVSKYPIRYEGFDNFRNLQNLKVFIAQHSPHLDDWCLDLITSELPNLQTMDLTGCKNITERGLVTLTKLRNLKHLILGDIPASNTSTFRLTCLMLEDDLPGLVVDGVELDPEVAEKAMKETPPTSGSIEP